MDFKFNCASDNAGEILRIMRQHRGLKQAEIAKISGYGKGSIVKWETMARDYTIQALIDISQALNFDVEIIVRDNKER